MENATEERAWPLGIRAMALMLSMFLIAATGGKEMHVTLGQEFKISLEANPTTGYTWEAHYDGHFFTLKEQRYEPLPAKGPGAGALLGAPGKAVFTFVPLKTGQTTIQMIYRRPWEKRSVQEETFKITIAAGA
jgi:inhibitor of cysteine peptidase